MEYSRGILFMPIGVGAIMFYSAIGLVIVLFHRKKIVPPVNALLLITFFLITAIFTWIQLANPGWLIINAGYAIVYIWCDLTVEDQRRQELYKASKPHYYDAILMDVRMPVMDGITAAKPFHLSY